MNMRRVVAGVIVALVLGMPALGWAEKSKRELLKERFQQKNILLNAPASSQTLDVFDQRENRKKNRRGKGYDADLVSEVSEESSRPAN